MTHLTDLEIIQINTVNGKLIALLSYRNPEVTDLNNGHDTVEVPVNIRELQFSVRGNLLVNQSLQHEAALNQSPQKQEP